VSNTNSFTVECGTSKDSMKEISESQTGTEEITYTSYQNKTTSEGSTTTANYYDFDLSGSNASFFQILCGSKNTIYIYKIVITYVDPVAQEGAVVKANLTIDAGGKLVAEAYDDYSFSVALPTEDLDPSAVTVSLSLTDVSSLGISGTRTIEKTVETGLASSSVSLENFLTGTYGFQGAKAHVTVSDGTNSQYFNYDIAAVNANKQIIGTPNKTDAARRAWQILGGAVEATTDDGGDSYLGFKAGSYIQIGDEQLYFDKDADFLKDSWDMASLYSDALDAVSIKSVEVEDIDTYKATVYIPTGSTIVLGSSKAVLKYDTKITFDVSNAWTSGSSIKGKITGLRETLGDGKLKPAIAYVVGLFDQIVGLVDAADEVGINVDIDSDKELVDFELSDINADGKTNVDDVTKLVDVILNKDTAKTVKVLKSSLSD